MRPRWDFGEAVRVIRNVRNDGTYPGKDTGDFLVRRGSIGHVKDLGTFLQDQIIYSVHFLETGLVVGCREEELADADAPWVDSRFEVREFVRVAKALSINGEILVPAGSRGEILNLERNNANIHQDKALHNVLYHVHFDCLPGRPLLVPEQALLPLVPSLDDVAA